MQSLKGNLIITMLKQKAFQMGMAADVLYKEEFNYPKKGILVVSFISEGFENLTHPQRRQIVDTALQNNAHVICNLYNILHEEYTPLEYGHNVIGES